MEEKVLISVEVDRDDQDFQQLAALKTTLAGIKEEQDKLNKAFKEGKITRQEHSQQIVKLEADYKKINATYTETQRKVTGLKAPFQDLKQAIADQTSQLNVAGISLASFANPVTATIAILGGLYKAYANSATGAKDLEFAHNQMSIAVDIVTEKFARLFSSSEDGEGFFSTLIKQATEFNRTFQDIVPFGKFFADLGEESRKQSLNMQIMEQLGRDLVAVQGDNNERLAENQELLTKIQDSQTAYNEKVHLTGEIIKNLRTNEDELLRIKGKELILLKSQVGTQVDQEKLEGQINEKNKEISRIKSDTERKVNSILRLESNLTDQYNKQIEAQKKLDAAKKAPKAGTMENTLSQDFMTAGFFTRDDVKTIKEIDDLINEQLQEGMRENTDAQNEELAKQSANLKAAKEKDAAFTLSLFQETTGIFQQELQRTNDIGMALVKAYLRTVINAFKRYIQFKLFGETLSSPQSIATLGVAGIIQFGVMNALIEAAFGLAENAISGFAEGGKISGGRPVRRSNGDNVLITARTGEVILNEQQQAALGGEATFRQLGVPGFAAGGIVTTPPFIPTMSPIINQSQINNLIRSINSRQVAVIIEEVEAKISQRAQIRERAQI